MITKVDVERMTFVQTAGFFNSLIERIERIEAQIKQIEQVRKQEQTESQ